MWIINCISNKMIDSFDLIIRLCILERVSEYINN